MLNAFAFIVSLISVVFAIYATFKTTRLERDTFRLDSYHQFDALLIEIDKLLVEHPKLWAIYDDSPPLPEDKLGKRQLEAFIHMHLDLFQMVHAFLQHRSQTGSEKDNEFRDSWGCYMKCFVHNSNLAREMLIRKGIRTVYYSSFVAEMDKHLESANNGMKVDGL